ncbi:nucleotidyltransferase domain-containing protein [Candidatus Kuenenbacteria bacterium]|nr:nucleotidyltransferase domain-containing protein [Candidatus Kuenenbacteria bacterium]
MAEKIIKFPHKIIDHYISTLEKKIRINGVLLFGSFAWGKPDKHSDVDLVIISPNFYRKNFNKRLDLLTNARDKITFQIAMDVIGYTPKEFQDIEKHSMIMTKAKRDGKWIY